MGKPKKNPAHRRAVNACVRCRQQKIKCTGDSPCSNCQLRKATCTFEGEEGKAQITKRRLSELERRNEELQKENLALQQKIKEQLASPRQTSGLRSSTFGGTPESASLSLESRIEESHALEHERMVNPLSTGPPKYITDLTGKNHWLGHTSSWALTMRLLHLMHQTIYKCPFPSVVHSLDAMTYDLGWNGLRSSVIPDIRGLPSLDHALFLINATKFHTEPIFFLFDEDTFLPRLYWFYENPAENIHTAGLWFIHFLVLAALGKAIVGSKSNGNTPPGAELFTKAFILLPDYCYLWTEPSTAGEIFCSVALYLQCVDWRVSAHNMISQALRIMLVNGYHTNIASCTMKRKALERSQNVWWTVFVLERRMSCLMGVPLGISDQDVSVPLPHFPDSPSRTATVTVHVKLAQAFGQIVNTLYRNGHLDSTYVKSTQRVLQSVANVASDLREFFPIPGQDSVSGISRVTGYMNILYHECIMLATRPFLFSLVERYVDSDNTETEVPTAVGLLLQICIESTRKTIYILTALQEQSLLDHFLPFDLESAVSAGLAIIMTTLVSPSLIEGHPHDLETIFAILDHMIDKGNLVAADQKTKLIDLEGLCLKLRTRSDTLSHFEWMPRPGDMSPQTMDGIVGLTQDPQMVGMEIGAELENDTGPDWAEQNAVPGNWMQNMSPSQLMAVVDMLNGDEFLDWATFPADDLPLTES